MLTEQEAREKWCPHARPVALTTPTFWMLIAPWGRNAATSGSEPNGRPKELSCEQHCLASDCAMWRWGRTHIDDGNGGTKLDTRTYGFCGLAGPPFAGYEVEMYRRAGRPEVK